MAEKKPKSSWGEAEQVGPYQLQEQVPQSEYSGGELYRATHETSGATALVLKPTGDKDGPAPQSDWRVRFISSDVREGMRRRAHAFSDPSEAPPWRRLGWALASTAAVCTLVFVLAHLVLVSQPPSDPARTEHASPNHEVPTDTVPPLKELSQFGPMPGGPLRVSGQVLHGLRATHAGAPLHRGVSARSATLFMHWLPGRVFSTPATFALTLHSRPCRAKPPPSTSTSPRFRRTAARPSPPCARSS